HDLHEAGVAALREALDAQGLAAPDQPIALIPCGRLGVLPLHAAWARRDLTGALVPLMETCELSYQPAAHTLATARSKAAQVVAGSVYAVGGPFPFASYEAEAIAALSRHAGRSSVALTGAEATQQDMLDLLAQARDGAVLDLATPGYIGDDTNAGYLQLAGHERLALAELQRDRLLDGVRLVATSGCAMTVGAGDMMPPELLDAAAGFLQSGAAGAVTMRWPAADRATALLMIALLGNWLANPARSPARALREAARWLRTATRRQLDELFAGGIPNVPRLPVGPEAVRGYVPSRKDSANQVTGMIDLPLDAMTRSDMPYHHPIYWAVAVFHGA
ncbi:MAG TPA: CHAT domain-containing protein, partial [Ktedonobacterales bacterium]|nr:CHAT domain-containing protein [Ktedonobacterales bacterium]